MSHKIRPTEFADSRALATWRRRTLTAAGFDAGLADCLAQDPRIDLHAVLELVDAGCPPALAARILAPLDRGEETAS